MKKIYFIIASALFIFAGCSQENIELPSEGGNGLVITAEIGNVTKTDINEGKSTWEKGDSISVIYDGKQYIYCAASDGATTSFTSANGIPSYDSSKELKAYYPVSDGTVSLAAERQMTFLSDAQNNAAKAPLVGAPAGSEQNTLKLNFKNVCSVIELRIEAGEITDVPKSLSIEPASETGFEGYLTFKGTVDYNTLGISATETGKSIKLNFPAGADLTQSQDIKIPVGRFSSSKGLKLTLETANGKTYSRTIYKSGVKTYTLNNGNYSLMHLAKALYPFSIYKGIASADDLVAFATAVNNGASIEDYKENGEVRLLYDIDMKGISWTPIGNPASTFSLAYNTSAAPVNPASGIVFNGDGRKISNLSIPVNIQTTQVAGLFGCTSGCTIKNLVIEDASLAISGAGGISASHVAVGTVVGYAYNTTISNVSVTGSITGSAKSSASRNVAIGGIAGMVNGTTAKYMDCSFGGKITADIGEKYSNTNTVMIGGIIGAVSYNSSLATISGCTNNATINVGTHRAAGILCNAFKAVVKDCVNNGDITANWSSNVNSGTSITGTRMGGIIAYCSTQSADGSSLINCANNGTMCTTQEGGSACGGVAGLIKCYTLKGCVNTGNVVAPAGMRGLLVGILQPTTTESSFSDCWVGGSIGAEKDGSDATPSTSDNYLSLGTTIAAGVTCASWNADNVSFLSTGANQDLASDEFSINKSAISFQSIGGQTFLRLNSKNWDWTVTASDRWIRVSDATGASLDGGSKSDNVQKIFIDAGLNTSSQPRQGTVVFKTADGSKSATFTISQEPTTEALPSRWDLSSSATSAFTDRWASSEHVLPATDGTSAYITAVRGPEREGMGFKFSVSAGKPYVSVLMENDYLLYTFPVKTLAAGSYIQFNTTLCPSANSSKYWILEWLDGGVWKSDESKLYTAPEKSSVKYTARLYYASSYQYATINQIIKVQNAIGNGELKIRLRAVGGLTCAGSSQSLLHSNTDVFLPVYGFSAAYCNKVAVDESKPSLKILCIGNSFSFYYAPTWKFQEIAASEGYNVDLVGHYKGSQTFENHLSLALTSEAINKAGFDYAFIQDQSQNPAHYAENQSSYSGVLSNCVTLAGNVKAKSPSCKVIVENTWSYPSGTYGGFGSYSYFDELLYSGTKSMAKACDAWISPIGQAFAIARSEYPSINLYASDSKHQGATGAYLKACVNYLVIFGKPFTANVSDCGLDHTVASNLRAAAEKAVLGKEADYYITR